MATSPASPPPPPIVASVSLSTQKRTRKVTQLRSLATRPPGAERPVVNVDPATGKADGPHKKKLRTYLGIVARDKVDMTYGTWKEAEFEIPEASSSRTKKKDVRKKAQVIQKQNTATHVLSRRGYNYLEQKLMVEKTKKKLEETAQFRSTEGVINPPSPIRRHDSLEEQASQGSFIPHGRQDVLTAAIGRPQHLGRVHAARAGVTIKQYFRSAARSSCSSSSIPHEELEQLTQQIRDQLEESIREKGLALPPEPEVGPSAARVSTKGSCVDPLLTDPETGDSDKCRLYIKANPSHLVALLRVYEGSTTVHNVPLLHGQVKIGVEEVKDAKARVPVPTDKALNTFVAWSTHLVKRVSKQVFYSDYVFLFFSIDLFTVIKLSYFTMYDKLAVAYPAKPSDRPDPEVDDPLYLMTLTILQLFLKPLQVMWDVTVFGVFNLDFPLYIKHKDLSEIAHGDQCLSISSIQRSGQSQFKSESYMKSWMQSSKRDVYLGAYLNAALKGLDDTPQPNSKAGARWIVVKTIGSKEIKGASHPVGTILSQS
ncbi:hypothetical protein HKD37_03G007258 [Glycine soja]